MPSSSGSNQPIVRLEGISTDCATVDTSSSVTDAILDDVRAFTQNTPQADDVTLVVLGYS